MLVGLVLINPQYWKLCLKLWDASWNLKQRDMIYRCKIFIYSNSFFIHTAKSQILNLLLDCGSRKENLWLPPCRRPPLASLWLFNYITKSLHCSALMLTTLPWSGSFCKHAYFLHRLVFHNSVYIHGVWSRRPFKSMGIFGLDKFLIKLISEVAPNVMTSEQKRHCVLCLCHSKCGGTIKYQGNKALVRNLTWHNDGNNNRYTKRKTQKNIICPFQFPWSSVEIKALLSISGCGFVSDSSLPLAWKARLFFLPEE